MARYREKLQHETEIELVWCTAGRPGQAGISLVTVEREVRVYSLVVIDPMLRCTDYTQTLHYLSIDEYFSSVRSTYTISLD